LRSGSAGRNVSARRAISRRSRASGMTPGPRRGGLRQSFLHGDLDRIDGLAPALGVGPAGAPAAPEGAGSLRLIRRILHLRPRVPGPARRRKHRSGWGPNIALATKMGRRRPRAGQHPGFAEPSGPTLYWTLRGPPPGRPKPRA
jgi:hypothetical protein